MVKKIAIIFLAVLIVFSLLTTVAKAADATSNFDIERFDEDSAGGTATDGVRNLVNKSSNTVISVARIVCVAIAIVMLLVIAMKYMIAAPGDRADIKKHSINYVIGAFILFGVSGILSIINGFAQSIKP